MVFGWGSFAVVTPINVLNSGAVVHRYFFKASTFLLLHVQAPAIKAVRASITVFDLH